MDQTKRSLETGINERKDNMKFKTRVNDNFDWKNAKILDEERKYFLI